MDSIFNSNMVQLYSIGAGGVVILFALKLMFNYLEKRRNGKGSNPHDYLLKTEHDKICDYKLQFLKESINNLKADINDTRKETIKRLDDIYQLILKKEVK